MTFWQIAWVVWFAMFLGIEIPAAVNSRRGDTLSEQVWNYVTRPHDGKAGVATWIGRAGVLVFLVWMAGHFLFGLWSL